MKPDRTLLTIRWAYAGTCEQVDAAPFYIRNKYIGLFEQDSWRLRTNLKLN